MRWTARFFSLAKPFDGFDVAGTIDALAQLAGSSMGSLRQSMPGEKRTRPMDLKRIEETRWNGVLGVSGRAPNGAELAISILRLPNVQEKTARAAQFRSHEISLDFEWAEPVHHDHSSMLRGILEVAAKSRSEIGIACPLASPNLKNTYRVRGLSEGIPGLFEFEVLKRSFAPCVDVKRLSAILGETVVLETQDHVAFRAAAVLNESMREEEREVRSAVGARSFAGPKGIAQETSGVFGWSELIKMIGRSKADDRAAQRTTADHPPELDWSGVFESD